MLKKRVLATIGLLVFLFAQNTCATLVEITVDTDKDVYELGEEVKVYVSVYNPGLDPVTLTFSSTLQASYWMDEIYYWHENKVFLQVLTHVTINSNTTHTRELIHGINEMQEYPLEIGLHTVTVMVVAYELQNEYLTEPVEFEVLPEPGTILLFGIGGFLLRRRFAK